MNAFAHMIQAHQGDPCELCDMPSGVTDNDECLGALLEQIRDIKVEFGEIFSQYEFFQARAKVMTRTYADLKDTSGEILKIDGAKASVTLPKRPRVYWNGKGLELYSRDHPEVRQFREEKWSAPAVRIIVD